MNRGQATIKTAAAGMIGMAGLMLSGSIAASAKTVVVKAGDSVWEIAKRHGVSVRAIEQANHLKKNKQGVDKIFAGQKLVLTTSAKATPKRQIRPVKNQPKNRGFKATNRVTNTYTVKPGESLWSIAARHGVSVGQLKSWNRLKSNFIYAGEKLVVKAGGVTSSSKTKPKTANGATKLKKSVRADAQVPTVDTMSVTSLAVKLAGMKIPYTWGGSSLKGMDCSGLVAYVYKHAMGVDLIHSTVAQEKAVAKHSVAAAQPGDILFWGTAGATYHDAIYIGNNQYVAAPQPGQTIRIDSISKYFMPSFAGTVVSS